jgi:hypothetical protein
MSTTEKLPRWASLLLTLLIGVVVTWGGQYFIAGAAPDRTGGSSSGKKCTLFDGTKHIKLVISGTVQSNSADSQLVTDLQPNGETGAQTGFSVTCK